MRMKYLLILSVASLLFSCGIRSEYSNLKVYSKKGEKIKEKRWSQINIGMKKSEVMKILGIPLGKTVVTMNDQFSMEFWEYEYWESQWIGINDKRQEDENQVITVIRLKKQEKITHSSLSYVIYFNNDGLVISLKRPRLGENINKYKFKENNWNKIKIGDSKKTIMDLLGIPLSVTKNPYYKDDLYYEFWEYKSTSNTMTEEPLDDAFVLFFDGNGLLKNYKK